MVVRSDHFLHYFDRAAAAIFREPSGCKAQGPKSWITYKRPRTKQKIVQKIIGRKWKAPRVFRFLMKRILNNNLVYLSEDAQLDQHILEENEQFVKVLSIAQDIP